VLVLLVAGLVVLLGTFGAAMSYLYGDRPPGRALGLDEVAALAQQGRIVSAVIEDADNVVIGSYEEPAPGVSSAIPGSGTFHASVPSGGQAFLTLTQLFAKSGTHYVVDPQAGKKTVLAVSTFLLPLVILADLFALFFSVSKGGGSAIGEVTTFGTIGKGGDKKGKSFVGFADVGGADEAVTELREVRDYLIDPQRYESLGAAPPKGVLLFGPPGTGKTLLAKAVAGEAGVPFFSVAGAEFVESLVGVGAARVRDLFARVRAAAPAIVFIDELDAAGRKRGNGGAGGGSDEREQTLNQLLVEMDGFEVSQGVVVMGATNRPDILDPALMRPGRFDRHITIERPEVEGRAHILRIHARNKPLDPAVDLDAIARQTPGFTGADLANVLNEATLLAIRDGRDTVAPSDVHEAIFRVQHGPKRRGRVLSEDERRRAAYHEAAHALVVAAHGRLADLNRVTLLGRGTVATTRLVSDDDGMVLTRSQLLERLNAFLSGMVGEELVLGEASTGCEHDIEQATGLAKDIVGRFGLSDAVGARRLVTSGGTGFLGGDDSLLGDVSEELQQRFDGEVELLLRQSMLVVRDILTRHRQVLDEVAAELQEHETLDELQLARLLDPVAVFEAAERNQSVATRGPRRSSGRSSRAPAVVTR
jgi:cell division protease FtsH